MAKYVFQILMQPVDIFSTAIIMFELLAGYHPLYDGGKDNEESFLKKLRNPQWNFPLDKFNSYFELIISVGMLRIFF